MTAATGASMIGELSRELGFARAAVVPIEPPRRHALYRSWLASGHAGTMAYLAAPDHIAQAGRLLNGVYVRAPHGTAGAHRQAAHA